MFPNNQEGALQVLEDHSNYNLDGAFAMPHPEHNSAWVITLPMHDETRVVVYTGCGEFEEVD